jgi:hypothetical protein
MPTFTEFVAGSAGSLPEFQDINSVLPVTLSEGQSSPRFNLGFTGGVGMFLLWSNGALRLMDPSENEVATFTEDTNNINGVSYTVLIASWTYPPPLPTDVYFKTSASVSKPAAPQFNIPATTNVGQNEFTVRWMEPSNNGGSLIGEYSIQYKTGDNNFLGGGVTTTTTGYLGGDQTYQITGLNPGTTYYFRVGATNIMGTTYNSGSSQATIPAFAPGAPQNLTTENATTTQFQVRFEAPSSNGGAAITRYYIQINTSNSWGSPLASSQLNAPFSGPPYVSTPFTDLTPGTQYYYRVGAMNSVGTTYTDGSASITLSSGGGPIIPGGGGDPYITTASGKQYKLPAIDAPIRFYQGEVDGETLTVNAQLRTINSSELLAYNLKSLIGMKGKLTHKQMAAYSKSLSKDEKLCFFESFYIKHGEKELAVNVWDGKIKVQKYVGKFDAKLLEGGETALAASGVYSNYKGATLSVRAGSATINMSAYLSPIVRSGITVDAPAMAAGNGVIVNVLAAKDMTLSGLEDTKAVARADAKDLRVHKEMFSDHMGTRVRNVLRIE